jgi:hypothetical protein
VKTFGGSLLHFKTIRIRQHRAIRAVMAEDEPKPMVSDADEDKMRVVLAVMIVSVLSILAFKYADHSIGAQIFLETESPPTS